VDLGELQVDQLRFMARTYGVEIAYRDLDANTALTFSEWDRASNRLARGLVAAGIEKGERVAILLPSEACLRWIVAYAAIHKAGAVAVPTNTRLSVPELVAILGHAEVAAVLTGEPLVDAAVAVTAELPSVRLLAGTDTTPWSAVEDSDDSDIQVPVGPEDLADVLYTSGTTGRAKGVAVSHESVAMIPNNEPNFTGGGWMHGAPLFTFAGIAFIYNPMKMGLTGWYLPRFDAGRWLDIVELERPVMAFLVPAMAELLVAHSHFESANLSSLKMVSIGSAPLAPSTLATLQARLPDASVSNSYGITEAGPAYIVMPKHEAPLRVGSVGKPVGNMEIRIVDDGGAELAAREIGELHTRLPGRRREYFRDPDATAATWTDDGWLRTGDLAYLDEDGFLYLVGRSKDLIIRGGHNVYPADVEAVLLEHPNVREAAVVGAPHDVLGEDVAAFVVARGGALDVDELSGFCAARLADYKRPRRIDVVEELPRNATGKVLKAELRTRLA